MDRFARSLATAFVLVAGCSSGAVAAEPLPKPAEDLAPTKPGQTKTLVVAGGCFWCVEAVFEPLRGVSEVVSGYAGGTAESAKYDQVSHGRTRHAEVVRVTYDPSQISYGTLLQVFFSTHDPTTKDRQGPDVGRHYRSAIFYADEKEKRAAAAYIEQLQAAKSFTAPIVTTLEPLEAFYPAEPYHQDFVRRHPDHGYVRQWALPKVAKVKERFPALLREGETKR